jgi:hypothetical protein
MAFADDWAREEEARWDRLEQLGVLVPVGQTVTGEHEVELVSTLADCVETTILYRAPRRAMIHPHPVWPAELARGGGHGSFVRDLQLMSFGPVQPHRKSIVLSVGGRSPFDRDGELVTVPVDRSATAPYDRHLANAPAPIETGGVSIGVLDANVGLNTLVVDVRLETLDPEILGLELGWPMGSHSLRHRSGPGPDVLWRDWFPDQPEGEPTQPIRRRLGGGMESIESRISLGGPMIARAKRRDPAQAPPPGPQPPSMPLQPISVTARPGGEPLRVRGGGGRSGPPMPGVQDLTSFQITAPPREATGVEIELRNVYAHRFGGGEVVVLPSPEEDRRVDIGVSVAVDGGHVEFVAWEPDPPNEGSRLVVRMPSPDWFPDIRVLVGEASMSFMANQSADGTVRCRVMGRDRPALEQPGGVPVALRMIGRQLDPVRIAIPLTALA